MVLEQKSFCRQQVAQELAAHMAEVASVDAVEVRRGAAGVLQIAQKGRGGSGGHSRTHVVDVFYFIVLHPSEGGGAELHTLTGGPQQAGTRRRSRPLGGGRDDNDFTPFRNIINEWYAKDTSKKIRAVFRAKGMSGKRLSTHAPYGYIKDSEGNLQVDEEAAPIVRLIFQLAMEGNGPGKIARILREMEIITPSTLMYERTGQCRWYDPNNLCTWSSKTIVNLLEQPQYLGHTVNFRTTKKVI